MWQDKKNLKRMFRFAIIVVISQSFSIYANSTLSEEIRKQNPDQVQFFLHTIDTGDLVFDNFGHTAIRLVNQASHLDLVFNWGVFDFSDPFRFSLTFYQGNLLYKLGVFSFRTTSQRYQIEGRTVWEDRLILDRLQKKKLLHYLSWHLLPQNRYYQYQYFFDNCSTRPRDFLNIILENRLKLITEREKTGESFRDMVRSHYRTIPMLALTLDIIMNSRIEEEMSIWQKMFLPNTLRQTLLQFDHPHISGKKVLEESSRPYLLFPSKKPYRFNGYGIFSLISLVSFILSWIGIHQSQMRIKRLGYRILSLSLIGWGIISASLGMLMLLSWFFSLHLDLHHNANLLMFWPTDVIYIIAGLKIGRRKGPWALSANGYRRLLIYTVAHGCALLCLICGYLAGMVTQDVSRVILFIAPINMIFQLFLLFWGCRANASKV